MAVTENTDRLVSLDVFRGITIAGMTLVNNPGTWSSIYGPLKHAEWNGITPTDYIFPFFLFIVGVAIPIAFAKRQEGPTRDIYYKILSRGAKIFALGLVIYAIPFFGWSETDLSQFWKVLISLGFTAVLYLYLVDRSKLAAIVLAATAVLILILYLAGTSFVWMDLATVRIPGVLQRIAVCYVVASIIFLNTTWRQQAIIGACILVGYWLMMTLIPVPGCGVTTIDDKACNFAAYLDRTILTSDHLWSAAKVFDPEGMLSTLPAIVTTMLGALTGKWLIGERDRVEKANGIFFAGTILAAAGWSWSLLFPLNKALWTSSFVLYTAGLALLTLGVCYWLVDVKRMSWWTKPFVVFGVNALALYVFSGILSNLLGSFTVGGADGKPVVLQEWIYINLFLIWADPINASLAYGLSYVAFWLLMMWMLYRQRIFIKV
jgi:predicted acyltransferase